MKTVSFLSLMLLSASLAAQASGQELLKTIDRQVSFLDSDFSAEVTLVQSTASEQLSETRVALYRRDREAKYLMLVLKPDVDKGKGYLKLGDKLWLYDPLSRRFTVTNARDRFQNTNARNSDFTQSTLAQDYKIVGTTAEKLGKLDTQVLDLQALRGDIPYPRCKIWVTSDNLVRKIEDFSLSGQKLRTTAVPSYQKLGTQFVPVSMVIVDYLRNERTQITIERPSLQKVPDRAFTQSYLETAGQ